MKDFCFLIDFSVTGSAKLATMPAAGAAPAAAGGAAPAAAAEKKGM